MASRCRFSLGKACRSEATPERYKELADAGFTISFSGSPDNATVTKMLDAAQTAGVKLYISSAELHSDPEGTCAAIQGSSGALAVIISSTSPPRNLSPICAWTKCIQSVDVEHPVYINLLPTYGNSPI